MTNYFPGFIHLIPTPLFPIEQVRRLLPSPANVQYDFSRPPAYGSPYGASYSSYLPTPALTAGSPPYPYNSGVFTTVPETPLRDASSWQNPDINSFCTMGTNLQPVLAPANNPLCDQTYPRYGQPDPASEHAKEQQVEDTDKPLSAYLKDTESLDERERLLLYHFVDDVLRLIFPILDLHKAGPVRAREILHSLETNKSYYHCSLSVSAIHLKTSARPGAENVERDIMQHRFKAVSHLTRALDSDSGHDQILDATLAMIFFHCSVGAPDDHLPDIPWNEHFTAVADLINQLGLIDPSPYAALPFSVSLTAWIDILGATMLGRSPQFAHTYRTKHLSGISSGLKELMGCDDRVMYLLSEIACLDSLKGSGRLDELNISHHVSALRAQIDHTEPADFRLEDPCSSSGEIDPERLTMNMTAIFRVAARIYLYSLMPSFDRSEPSIFNLVEAASDLLNSIPTGPYGFDRSLVWPLLVVGTYSTPEGSFRGILAQRATALGESGDFGSFGRMYRVLQEVWKIADNPPMTPAYTTPSMLLPPSDLSYDQPLPFSSLPQVKTMGQPVKKQPVHWRDVMKRYGWRYLLI